MAPVKALKTLNATIDNTPIVDNHAHPLLKPAVAVTHSLLPLATEAHGDALKDTWSSLAHIRATNQLAKLLGCEPKWEAVEAAIQEKRTGSHEAWVRRCLQGVETILVDDGLDDMESAQSYSWHDRFTNSKCKRIVRIEAVATDIIRQYCETSAKNADGKHLTAILRSFVTYIEQAIEEPDVVGFKSIICYRSGLDIPLKEDVNEAEASNAIQSVVEAYVKKNERFKRLQHAPLNHLLVHITAQLIKNSDSPHKKPIQFHTGLGDNDITLTRSSPSHLQTFIRQYPTVPIVILHASYPWTQEAGYLAAMYANVYADIGEVFPFLSEGGQENVIRQILELCPWSKVLWSTDGHWFPETYLLAIEQARAVLKTVLGELVTQEQLSEVQAVQLVQDILYTNSVRLYDLKLPIPAPSLSDVLSKMTISDSQDLPGTEWSNQKALQRLGELDFKWLRTYWHDYTSSSRCRLVPRKKVLSRLEGGESLGLTLTKASLGVLQVDMTIPGVNSSGMYKFLPDWSTLRAGPAPGHVSCYGDFRELDGSPTLLCPRTLLRSVLETAAKKDLTFLVGFEIEFVAVKRNPDPSSPEKYLPLPSDGHNWSCSSALVDMGKEGSFSTAVDEMVQCLEEAGIDLELVHPEGALGQYEFVLPPLPPLEACDTLLHARQVIYSAAARNGFRVTLHPKPFANALGSAGHAHMSISSPGGNKPEVYESFYAGILKHFNAIIAVTYSNPTSYERMVDSFWAGGRWACWGVDNKDAPLRKCEDSHWEIKTLDGLANPYFAMAAIFAAGTAGVASREPLTWKNCLEDPAKLTPEQREALGITTMFPANLEAALVALEEDEALKAVLGEQFVERYIGIKKGELGLMQGMTYDERRIWVMDRY